LCYSASSLTSSVGTKVTVHHRNSVSVI
jgi:hypothetical protein